MLPNCPVKANNIWSLNRKRGCNYVASLLFPVPYIITFILLRIMKKTQKNKVSKKSSLLGGAAKSLKKLSRGTSRRIGGLSTTQKVVGGAALVALGLSYLSKRLGPSDIPAPTDATTTADAGAAEETLATMHANA